MTSLTPVVRLLPYYREAALFPAPPLGWIMHSQEGDNSPYGWFKGLKSPNRVFSHFWISKTGVIEQYGDLRRQSWAQGAGNPLYISVEFEGFVREPLTSTQVLIAARMHNLLKTVDLIANKPGQHGIGTHGMGGDAWGHPNCPGKIRAAQRYDILKVARRLKTAPQPPASWNPNNDYTVTVHPGDTGTVVRRIQARLYVLPANGQYNTATVNAVKAFQKLRRLDPDGIVGPLTWKALFHP